VSRLHTHDEGTLASRVEEIKMRQKRERVLVWGKKKAEKGRDLQLLPQKKAKANQGKTRSGMPFSQAKGGVTIGRKKGNDREERGWGRESKVKFFNT